MGAASISRTLTRRLCNGGGSPVALGRIWVPLPPQPQAFSSSCCSFSSYAISSSVPESQSASSSQVHGNERRWGWSKLLLFLPGALTFGLGTWQIFRRQDKIKMLEYRQKRLEMEPLMFKSISPSNGKLDSLEFRKVKCKGVFDEERSIYVGPRSRSISGVTENGYYVITPLMPIPNSTESVQSPILVNRGWVPRSWRDQSLEDLQSGKKPPIIPPPSVEDSEGSSWWRFWSKKRNNVEVNIPAVIPTEVVGVIRGSEKPSIFVPANDPSSFQWFYIDVPAIARAAGLPEDTIYIEDINENVNPSNPYPVPKDVNTLVRSSVMPQDHLNYTLTWYSLSAAVTFMAFKRLKPKRSRR
ncbi:surfeit locus protein 1 [Corylus avellana]|uniref:surfeit locus protein 1 n=1 Tax=Corylus avellana TaxID=13451 RepID=UPI00286AB228|nr:surfeit locus protein 1 [Corylus avellana]XP_059455714.1 surfeit locus protein 1 [Corylus avellana]XP_059455716.1 surfeit locus protein 1 [Corylus avellana]